MADPRPNHHADYRGFGGPFGYLAGLTMIAGRGDDARLVVELAAVEPGDCVLDIGCGPGTAARLAAATGVQVIGVDPAEPMLRLARVLAALRRPEGDISWRQARAEDLGLPDGSITVCWSLASVHHWPKLEEGLAEVKRVLAPGGRFVALEKRTADESKGLASHGWTAGQASTFAAMLDNLGFVSVAVENHDLGRRKVVSVSARKPDET